jgi:ubiquinone/menaquinone biosynthesis C-methylase UbiE
MDTLAAEKEMDELKKAYDKIADDFSGTRRHAWPEFDLFLDVLSYGQKVLDLGCGNGRLYEKLRGLKIDYTGVDFSKGLLEIARKTYGSADFVEANMVRLPFEAETFDAVVSVAAFHHLPGTELRKKAFEEAFRVLRPDGLLVFTVWNLWQMQYLGTFIHSFSRSITSQGRYGWKDLVIPFGKKRVKRYYYAFSSFELRRLLKQCGFEVLELNKHHGKRYNYFVVARKKMLKAVQHPLTEMEQNITVATMPEPQALSEPL